MFEDAKVTIRSDNLKDRQYNDQKKNTNTADKFYPDLCWYWWNCWPYKHSFHIRKLQIKQHYPSLKRGSA